MKSSDSLAPPAWTRFLVLAAAVAILLSTLSCGRKGDPRPRSELSSEVGRPAGAPASSGG